MLRKLQLTAKWYTSCTSPLFKLFFCYFAIICKQSTASMPVRLPKLLTTVTWAEVGFFQTTGFVNACNYLSQLCVGQTQNNHKMWLNTTWNMYLILIFLTDRMSEGDSVGESIHGRPSTIAAFFTRLGQVTWDDRDHWHLSIDGLLYGCRGWTEIPGIMQIVCKCKGVHWGRIKFTRRASSYPNIVNSCEAWMS